MNAQEAWATAYNQLQMQFDRAQFDTWLRDAEFLDYKKGLFIVSVPNSYARDMLQHRLYRNIKRVLNEVWQREPVEIQFEVCKAPAKPVADDDEMPLFRMLAMQSPEYTMNNVSDKPLHQQIIRPQRPDLPDSELNPRFTFERFVIGNEQPIAYPAAVAVSERPGMAYNPLLIYGGSGLGKTHLLHSIAHVCQNNGLRAIYISSEAFTNDLIDAIRTRTTPMFREKYRSADVLLVDDIQFIVGKESTQEEFFHTFNTLHMYGKQVVIASDRHPKDIVGIADRLRSRFLSGLMVDVQMPTLETRIAILQMWAKERGVVLPLSVAEMLANRARHNVRELESVFNQVAANAELGGQPLSLELAEAVQEGFHRPREHNITVAHVMNVTAKWHDLNVSDLIGPRRTGAVSQARQIAMYLAREMTTSSLPQIGKEFGGRRHSTVLHSCNKVSDDLVKDDLLRQAVKDIRDLLTKGG